MNDLNNDKEVVETEINNQTDKINKMEEEKENINKRIDEEKKEFEVIFESGTDIIIGNESGEVIYDNMQ